MTPQELQIKARAHEMVGRIISRMWAHYQGPPEVRAALLAAADKSDRLSWLAAGLIAFPGVINYEELEAQLL